MLIVIFPSYITCIFKNKNIKISIINMQLAVILYATIGDDYDLIKLC